MAFKTLSTSIALVCALATQGVAQTKSLSASKDTGPSPFQTFGTKKSAEPAYGQVHPEWTCDERGFHCILVMVYCEKDFGCTEL